MGAALLQDRPPLVSVTPQGLFCPPGGFYIVSGDYKRTPDPTCVPFEVVRCDTLHGAINSLVACYREALPQDAAWAQYFLTGRRLKRLLTSKVLVPWTPGGLRSGCSHYDLLEENGEDLRGLPLRERRWRLEALLKDKPRFTSGDRPVGPMDPRPYAREVRSRALRGP